MTTGTTSGLNGLLDCLMKIDVIKMSAQTTSRSGAYSIKVPLSSLSRTMQFIHRSGGKLVNVTNLSAITTLAGLPPIETPVYTSTSSLKAPAPARTPAPAATQAEQQSAQDRLKKGGKHNKR